MTSRLKPEIKEEVLDFIIRDFKTNYSYRLLNEIQESRIGMRLYEFSKNPDKLKTSNELYFKHKYFRNDYESKFYIVTPVELVTHAEREHARLLKQYKYKFIPLSLFNTEFNKTFDIFHNGLKIPKDEIEILYTDYHTFICIPWKYKSFVKLHVLYRTYGHDELMRDTNQVIIDKDTYNRQLTDKLFVYCNGKLTEDYTKSIELNGNIKITVNAEKDSYIEVCCYPYYIKKMTVPNTTKYFKIEKETPFKFPVTKQGLLLFENNLLSDVSATPKTSYIFKIDKFYSETIDVYIFYDEQKGDINAYRDKVTWYADRHGDIIEQLNEDTVPEFVRQHKLSDIDLSIDDFVKSGLPLLEYMHHKFEAIIQYDYDFYNYYINEVMKRLSVNEYSLFMDLSKYNLDEITRLDNHQEILDDNLHETFITNYIVVPFPNREEYKFNIYIDGINHFDYMQFNFEGKTYVYIRKSKVTETSMIEIELFKSNKDQVSYNVVLNEDKEILVTDEMYTRDKFYLRFFIYDTLKSVHRQIFPDETVENGDGIGVTFPGADSGSIIKIVNTFCEKKYKYRIKQYKQTGATIELPREYSSLNHNINNYRLYKNGKLIPRSSYTIEFPDFINNNSNIIISINDTVKFVIAEIVTVEYTPNGYKEVYGEKTIEEYGRIRLDKGILDIPINDNLMSHYLNGRRINDGFKKIRTNNGMEIFNVHTRRNYVMLMNEELFYYINDFVTAYNTGRDLFDEYIKSIMIGKKIIEEEDDMLEKDITRMSDLYYDLYQEYLKMNITDFGKKLPEYIAFKYDDLVTEEEILYIRCDDEDVKYWMPLDATIDYSNEHFTRIEGLYYQLMENIKDLKVVDMTQIPDELYEKYKELFDNNVLVLEVPNLNHEGIG